MRRAARRAATTMTTDSTAERTLLRGAVGASRRTGSAGGRSGGGAVRGGDWSTVTPRVSPSPPEASATPRAIPLQQPAGGLATGIRQRRVRRLGHVAVGSETEE